MTRLLSFTLITRVDPFVVTGFGFESETGFSFGMYVKQTISIQPVSMDS